MDETMTGQSAPPSVESAGAEPTLPAADAPRLGRPDAGFGRRLAARGIDVVILSLLLSPIWLGVLVVDPYCQALSCGTWLTVLLALAFVSVAGYEILSTVTAGGTVGKRAVRIEIARADGAGRPSVVGATFRFLVLLASVIFWPILLLSFFTALRNRRKRL